MFTKSLPQKSISSHHVIASRYTHYQISNMNATKLISNLYTTKDKTKLDKYQKIEIVKKAVHIYNAIDICKPNASLVIDELSNLFLQFGCPHKIFSIWEDIVKLRSATVSYSLLLQCCVQAKDLHKAVQVLHWMKENVIQTTTKSQHKTLSIHINKLVSLCNGNVQMIHQIHALVDRIPPLKHDVFIQTALINAYGTCADVPSAVLAFNSIPTHQLDHILISSMMKVFVHNECYQEALSFYNQYKHHHIDALHVLAIKTCIKLDDCEQGKDIVNTHLDIPNASINTKNILIHFYGYFDAIHIAMDIFHSIPPCDKTSATIGCMMNGLLKQSMNNKVISLSNEYAHLVDDAIRLSVIDAYSNIGDTDAILKLFDCATETNQSHMIGTVMKALIDNHCDQLALSLYKQSNVFDNTLPHIMALKACMNTDNSNEGKAIHSHLIQRNVKINIELQTMLIELNGYFGDINAAQTVFNTIRDESHSVSSISAMMKCFIRNEHYADALELYDQYNNACDNDILHLLAVKACTKRDAFDRGKCIIDSLNTPSQHMHLKHTLIDFYGHFGDISTAEIIFDSISDDDKEISSIGAMMNAYYDCKLYSQCIDLFKSITEEWTHLQADIVCYTIVLLACFHTTSYHFGNEIYRNLQNNSDGNKWMLSDSNIQCAVIDLFGKTGHIETCQQIFDGVESKNIYIWNSMIDAFGRNGDFKNAKRTFERLTKDTALQPNRQTLIAFINCCTHCNEPSSAFCVWKSYIECDDALKCDSYVMSGLVDCYARNGRIKEALDLLKEYETYAVKQSDNDKTMYLSILNGCNIYKNEEIAQEIYLQMKAKFNESDNR
eukprot:913936_1